LLQVPLTGDADDANGVAEAAALVSPVMAVTATKIAKAAPPRRIARPQKK
jgi:hypothetical protein